MLARVGNDFAQQQRPRRPAAVQQFMPLRDSVVIAVAAIGADQPGLAGEAEFIPFGENVLVDRPFTSLRSSHRSTVSRTGPPRKQRPLAAFILVAVTKLRVRHRRKRGRLELDMLDRRLKAHRHPQQSCIGRLEPEERPRDCHCSQNRKLAHV